MQVIVMPAIHTMVSLVEYWFQCWWFG